jgi:opacity protein-like surface antigen
VIRHEKDQIGKEAVMLSPQELNTLLRRLVAGAVALILLLLAGISVSQAAEIIPAVGLSKPVNGDDNGQFFGSLAFRSQFLVPMLQSEIGVGYRQENRFNDQLKIKQWPVTASLYFKPVPVLYAGGGVGWYNTTFDYKDNTLVQDETRQDFGVHLGGGFQVPIGPSAAMDLSGRYVMLRDQEAKLIPEKFNPDFWTTQLGLAIKF